MRSGLGCSPQRDRCGRALCRAVSSHRPGVPCLLTAVGGLSPVFLLSCARWGQR